MQSLHRSKTDILSPFRAIYGAIQFLILLEKCVTSPVQSQGDEGSLKYI